MPYNSLVKSFHSAAKWFFQKNSAVKWLSYTKMMTFVENLVNQNHLKVQLFSYIMHAL